MRLSKEEKDNIMKKASSYPSVSSFILDAANSFDDTKGAKKIKVVIEATKKIKEFEELMRLFANNVHSIAMYCNRCTLLGIDDTEPLTEAAKYTQVSEELRDAVYAFTTRFEKLVATMLC